MKSLKNKKGQAVMWGILGILVLIIGVGGFALFSSGTFQKTVEGGDEVVIVECDSTTSPNLSIKAIDKEKNTALTEATNLYRLDGEKTWNTFTAGTAFALDVGQKIDYVMGIDTSDFTDNSYGQLVRGYEIPCKEAPSIEMEMAADEIETELTATFLDENEDASAQVFTVSQQKTVYLKLEAGVDQYFGNPFLDDSTSNVMCLSLNSTTWETPVKAYILEGADLNPVSTPKRHAVTAGKIDYCYELPVIDDQFVKIAVKLEADGTTAPGVDDTASFYAANYYFNSDNGLIEFGVENEDGTAVGTDAADTLTLDFT